MSKQKLSPVVRRRLRQKFRQHARAWRKQTQFSTRPLDCSENKHVQTVLELAGRSEAHRQQIVALVLEEMLHRDGYWSVVLAELTGEEPVGNPQSTVTMATIAWLEWGRDHGYIHFGYPKSSKPKKGRNDG